MGREVVQVLVKYVIRYDGPEHRESAIQAIEEGAYDCTAGYWSVQRTKRCKVLPTPEPRP